jgi:hypothetical protein
VIIRHSDEIAFKSLCGNRPLKNGGQPQRPSVVNNHPKFRRYESRKPTQHGSSSRTFAHACLQRANRGETGTKKVWAKLLWGESK